MKLLESVPVHLKPYVTYVEEPNPEERRLMRMHLRKYLMNKINTLIALKTKMETRQEYKTDRVVPNARAGLQFLYKLLDDTKNDIFRFEEHNLVEIVAQATEARELVKENPNLHFDVQAFASDFLNIGASDETYQTNKRHKIYIARHIEIYRHINRKKPINGTLTQQMLITYPLFDKEIKWGPPSEFDETVYNSIMSCSLSAGFNAAAYILSQGEKEAAFQSIGELCNKTFEAMAVSSDSGVSLVYTAIIRNLFDAAYPISQELNAYVEDDARFIEQCQLFSEKTVRELNFSKPIEERFSPGLPISSLFSPKQSGLLKVVEFMTNPLDIVGHLTEVLKRLAMIYGREGSILSFDDTLSLLIGLMSVSPPSNSVSIARFLLKWTEIQLSIPLELSKNYFIAAVDHISPLGIL